MIDSLVNFLFLISFMPLSGLIITIIIEWLIYSIIIRKDIAKLLGYSILINGITNPIANILFSSINFFPPILFIIIETIVIVSEIFLIKNLLQMSYKKAIIISIVANLITGFLSIIFR